jgi:hypothetical protein
MAWLREVVTSTGLWVVVALTAGLSGFYGFFVLVSSGYDQDSPIPGRQKLIAIAGVVAAGMFLVFLLVAEPFGAWDLGYIKFLLVVVLVGAVCLVPLWRRAGTMDVTDAGFGHARYGGTALGLYLYNATDAPIVVCVRSGDACAVASRYPAPLRAPGRTIASHRRVSLEWPSGLYGTFTLGVSGDLAADARRTTTFEWSKAEHRPTI